MNPAALNGNLENIIAAITPGGIERQELEGQRELVSTEVSRLPKEINGYNLQDEKMIKGYALLGIEVLDEHDDIFLNVRLPTGWKLQATDHSMYSDLLDNQGRKRGSIFYKAAFYDRRANFDFITRFRVVCEPEDAHASYETYKKLYGRVYDGNTVIFESEGRERIRDDWNQREELCAEAEAWLVENGYPDFNDPLLYW